jgi:radical SAM superfamily enzyme YgiQ (UPF0313 family)
MDKYDILLAYPDPSTDSPVKLTPLSILFPGAMFEKAGMTVAYYDERFDPQSMLSDLIMESKEIGVSAFTGTQAGRAADILIKAKEIKSSIITGVGGHHARILPDQVLAEPFVDKVWSAPSYGEDLFPYNDRTKIHFQRTDMQYFTSRGCPHSCSFCCLASPWVPKDIDEVDRELKTIHDDIKFTNISFSDPNIAFGIKGEDRIRRIKQVGKIMRDINVKWDGNLRAPYFTPEMVEALVEANCCSIEIGCESGNDLFLKTIIKKGHGVEAIKTAAKNVKGSGVSVMYSFIGNMPRETKEMLMDTMDLIDWIVETDPDARVSIYNYAPYPGSRMYADAVAGVDGYPAFIPPTTMKGWANLPLMKSPLYWIAGLCFRKDNSKKNFQGKDWQLIEPYIKLAEKKWRARDITEFPCDEVEALIRKQSDKVKSQNDQTP